MTSRLARGAFAAALFALAGSAQAQTSMTLYGLADMSFGRTQAPGGVGIKTVDSGKMTTSFFGFKGTEDLGGGLSAIFAFESFIRIDTGEAGRFNGDPFWARSAFVGLSSGLGSLTLGRNTTSLFVQTLLFNPLGDSFGYSPAIRHYFTSGTTTGDTGWSDSVKYTSPRLGGATFTVHGTASENNAGPNVGASALYLSGTLGLGAAWQKVRNGVTVADTTSWQLGASYDFKVTKLFVQYGNVKNDTTGNDFDISGLGVAVPVGAGKILGQWGRIGPATGNARTTISLGYDYDVSKRTDVYVVAMSDKIAGTGAGTGTGKSASVGVRHKF